MNGSNIVSEMLKNNPTKIESKTQLLKVIDRLIKTLNFECTAEEVFEQMNRGIKNVTHIITSVEGNGEIVFYFIEGSLDIKLEDSGELNYYLWDGYGDGSKFGVVRFEV